MTRYGVSPFILEKKIMARRKFITDFEEKE
jgi:hypothetical protein